MCANLNKLCGGKFELVRNSGGKSDARISVRINGTRMYIWQGVLGAHSIPLMCAHRIAQCNIISRLAIMEKEGGAHNESALMRRQIASLHTHGGCAADCLAVLRTSTPFGRRLRSGSFRAPDAENMLPQHTTIVHQVLSKKYNKMTNQN